MHRLSEHIVHLKRGNIFELEGKLFFVFGGCKSSGKWKQLGLWYPQEEATEGEIALAYRNLQKVGNNVDYIFTHKYKLRAEDVFDKSDPFEALCNYIDESVQFTHWYAGHWHITHAMDSRHTIVFDEPYIL